jgi:hypothetical protein
MMTLANCATGSLPFHHAFSPRRFIRRLRVIQWSGFGAVRARLEAAKLCVLRLEDFGEGEDPSASVEERLGELLRKRQQQSE